MLYTQCLLEVGPKPSETRNGYDKKEYKDSPNTQCKLKNLDELKIGDDRG